MRFVLVVSFCLGTFSLLHADELLLDFYADWCGPCRQMAPIVQRLEQRGLKVRRVNVDREPTLAAKFNVRALPTFVFLRDGREVGRLVGAVPERELVALVAPVTPNRQAPRARTSSPAHTTNSSLYRHLLDVSVRLYRETGSARYYGSGTIIWSSEREALVLTCAHLFRASAGLGQRVIVEWFGVDPPVNFSGRLVARDRHADLALVRLRTDRALPSARIAGPTTKLRPGMPLYSVGCDRGSRPRVYATRLTSVNRYVGAPNYEILGAPRQGRSGGGLFTSDGELVGVCSAADPYGNRGLFAALGAVHYLLAAAKLQHLYRPQTPSAPPSDPGTPPVQFARTEAQQEQKPFTLPDPEQLHVGAPQVSVASSGGAQPSSEAPDSSHRQLAIRGSGGEAEIVCVIRPLGGSDRPSRVIVLRRASPELVRLLEAHARSETPVPTKARISHASFALATPASYSTANIEIDTRLAQPAIWRPKAKSRTGGRLRLLAPSFK